MHQGVNPNLYDTNFTTTHAESLASSTLIVALQFIIIYVVVVPLCDVLQKGFRNRFLSQWDTPSTLEEKDKSPLDNHDPSVFRMRRRTDSERDPSP